MVEVLITLIIVSLSGLALMTAFTTTITGTAQQRSLAGNDTLLRTVAESAYSQIQQNQVPWYNPCATTSTYNYDFQNFLSNQPANSVLPTNYAVTLSMQNMVLNTSTGTWQDTDASTPMPNCASLTMAPQLVTVVVTAPNGTSETTEFVVNGRNGVSPTASLLSLDGLSPSSVGQGYQFQTVTITGSGFNDAATISVCLASTATSSGCPLPGPTTNPSDVLTPVSTQYVSSTTLTMVINVSVTQTTGTYAVFVQNPTGSPVSGTLTITPAPSVVSVASPIPSTLTQGVTNEQLVITGDGFQSGLSVSFSPSTITPVPGSVSVTSSTQFTVLVNVSSTASLGGVAITATNNTAQGTVVGAPSSNILSVVAPPVIASGTSCSFSVGTASSCTINGTGFLINDAILLSNAGLFANGYSTTYVSSTQLVLSGTPTASGTSDLQVSPPDAANGAASSVLSGAVQVSP